MPTAGLQLAYRGLGGHLQTCGPEVSAELNIIRMLERRAVVVVALVTVVYARVRVRNPLGSTLSAAVWTTGYNVRRDCR